MTVRNLILFLLLAAAPLVVQAGSLRCGSKLVSIGDSSFRVQSLCGEPSAKEHVAVNEKAVVQGNDQGVQESRKTVKVEKWTYNFGPGQLLKILTFSDGTLTKIESGGRM
ncbi:MAG: DUF2845 domain-containing protein [Proteobacteria bacterium]|jgi:hypothetical protein|nr:DUF2845 domain-containing protein [Pseudomonadota bacterium]